MPEVIGDCGRKGVRAAVVVSAGFREGGVAGAGSAAIARRIAT